MLLLLHLLILLVDYLCVEDIHVVEPFLSLLPGIEGARSHLASDLPLGSLIFLPGPVRVQRRELEAIHYCVGSHRSVHELALLCRGQAEPGRRRRSRSAFLLPGCLFLEIEFGVDQLLSRVLRRVVGLPVLGVASLDSPVGQRAGDALREFYFIGCILVVRRGSLIFVNATLFDPLHEPSTVHHFLHRMLLLFEYLSEVQFLNLEELGDHRHLPLVNPRKGHPRCLRGWFLAFVTHTLHRIVTIVVDVLYLELVHRGLALAWPHLENLQNLYAILRSRSDLLWFLLPLLAINERLLTMGIATH